MEDFLNFNEIVLGENTNVDLQKYKARALLVNSEGKILVAKYAGVYLLPGGTIEKGEDLKSAINRELKEEIGMGLDDLNLYPMTKITHYQTNYLERDGSIVDRLLTTYYYMGSVDNIQEALKNTKLTQREKEGGFSLDFYTLEELANILNSEEGKKNIYFTKELNAIINEYTKKLDLDKNI